MNAFTQKTVVRIIHARVSSALDSNTAVFVAVKELFANGFFQAGNMKAKMN